MTCAPTTAHITMLIGLCGVCSTLSACGLSRHAHPTHMYTEPLVANTQDRRAIQRHHQRALAQRIKTYTPVHIAAKRSTKRARKADKKSKRVGGRQASSRPPRAPLALSVPSRQARMPSPTQPNTQHPVAAKTQHTDASHAAQFAWVTWARAKRALPAQAKHDIERMAQACKKQGVVSFKRIQPGDLVFFHNAHDKNKDGRNNDWYTHVGVAESTNDHTAVVAAYQDGKVRRLVINLKHPSGAWRHGRQINTQLRPRRKTDLPFTQYMAGELFAGACSTLPRKAIPIDLTWKP